MRRILAVLVGVLLVSAAPAVAGPSDNQRIERATVSAKPINVHRMRKHAKDYASRRCMRRQRYTEVGVIWIQCVNWWSAQCRPDPIFYSVLGSCDIHYLLAKHSIPTRYQECDATVFYRMWEGRMHRLEPTTWLCGGWRKTISG